MRSSLSVVACLRCVLCQVLHASLEFCCARIVDLLSSSRGTPTQFPSSNYQQHWWRPRLLSPARAVAAT
ncbi:hypothetical protein WJX72_009575 [[Myrmecia] bisecta]|uniref:Secreted protein n=1 Tax=[Myrmecia] bisecta TaxID=41462 RepID=A0AAW1QGJ2_9CHLO